MRLVINQKTDKFYEIGKSSNDKNKLRINVKIDRDIILKDIKSWKDKCFGYAVIFGVKVKLSTRLLVFTKSTRCHICNVEGSYFYIEKHVHKNETEPSWHLNLYANKNGREILMTRDHIYPKSKGGKNTLENSQTLCVYCNSRKSNKI